MSEIKPEAETPREEVAENVSDENRSDVAGTTAAEVPGVAEPANLDQETEVTESEAETIDVEALKAKLEEAQRQAEEYLDNWRRTAAEFANYRKRKEREVAEFEQRANERLIARLLPILDDLQRALENVPEELQGHEWVEGIRLIERKFWSVLKQEGVEPIESEPGMPFDPLYHEALFTEESEDHEAGHILEVYQHGYRYKGKVLRPARVRVAR